MAGRRRRLAVLDGRRAMDTSAPGWSVRSPTTATRKRTATIARCARTSPGCTSRASFADRTRRTRHEQETTTMAKRATTPTADTGRVRCSICGQRTRNLDRHTAEAHAPSVAVDAETLDAAIDHGDAATVEQLVADTFDHDDAAEMLDAIAEAAGTGLDFTPADHAAIDAALTVPDADEPQAASAPVTGSIAVPTPRGSIMDRAVCLSVSKGRFGNTRRASTSSITVNAEKSMLALSKRLLSSPELVAIRRLDNEVWAWLQAVALPSMFKGGVYLVPIPMIETIEAQLHAFAEQRVALVNAFVAKYPQQVLAIREQLRDLYDPRDYPSVETLRGLFYFEWQYVTFGVPGTLKQINASLFKAEQEKAAAKINEAADECRQVMRGAMRDLIEHMVDRLRPTEDGTRKIFRNSLVENMNDFLKTFEMRDITDDDELGKLVARARGIMSGVDAETLRSNEALRDAIAGSMADVKTVLDSMVVERTRRITFDDEQSSEGAA